LDEQLLLITSSHRFLLITPRELIHYRAADLDLAHMHRFERNEQICLVRRWAELKEAGQLVLVSTQGYARKFDMTQMRPLIEGPTPAKIDWTLPGWPRVVFGAETGAEFVLLNNLGRAVRLPVDSLRRTGSRLMTKQKTDEMISGWGVNAEEWLWLFATEGYAKWTPVAQIPLSTEANPQSVSIVRRRGEICGVVTAAQLRPLWALTTQRLLPIDPNTTPSDLTESLAMHKALALTPGEQALGLFTS
jgi:DNA gyrase/topoisomerase IV subunit A